MLERIAVVCRHAARRDAGDFGDDFLDFVLADGLFLFGLGQDALCGSGFVQYVDGLVRQVAVVDETRRQFGGTS